MTQNRRQFVRVTLGFLALCTGLLGCEQSESRDVGQPAAQASFAPKDETVVVFAASSLRDAFAEIAKEFRRQHPRVAVKFNFAGTQELRTQVEQGAKADVFASADPKHMDALVQAKLVSAPVIFARNEPVIVVARESGAQLKSIGDLPSASRIVIGTPEVPIGRYTEQILDLASARLGRDFRARVEAKVVSRELNVKQVLAKVSLGEAQAGIVYRSDVHPDNDVFTVEIPSNLNVIAEYPIAEVRGAPHPTLARAWVELVSSADGQRRLSEAGFLPPSVSAARP